MQADETRETASTSHGNTSHWKLTLSYNGSGFHGWQVQPGLVTVQGTLAKALTELTGEQVLPQGSGRTDAGVHALAQVASFRLPITLPPANLQRALNRILPTAMRVLAAEVVPPGFHARHSALRKHYQYRIFERRPAGSSTERICSPFLAPFVWDCRWPLQGEPMQRAADLLLGTQDFTAMAATRRDASFREACLRDAAPHDNLDTVDRAPGIPNPVKTIYSAGWTNAEGLLLFNICGSGFLHHMVRNLVGTMVEIGRGSLAVEALPAILASKNRANAGPTAPASGLYLRDVEYGSCPAFEGVSGNECSAAMSSAISPARVNQAEPAGTVAGVSH